MQPSWRTLRTKHRDPGTREGMRHAGPQRRGGGSGVSEVSEVQPLLSARALQRLVMLTTVLSAAGSRGWPALRLAEHLGFGGTDESKRESLARDIRRLRSIGVEITNIAEAGVEAQYVLHPSDSRIRLAFDPEQRAQLARAAVLADRGVVARALVDDVAQPPVPGAVSVAPAAASGAIDRVLRAVTAGCELRFTYNGKPRILDPATVVHDAAGWAVAGVERTVGERRTFYVSRMTKLRLGVPGSAVVSADSARNQSSPDPLSWSVDEAVTARLQADERYADDVERLLGSAPLATQEGATIIWAYRVTNRWVFLARVIELGERVVLLGPPQLRDELRERLLAVLAAAP